MLNSRRVGTPRQSENGRARNALSGIVPLCFACASSAPTPHSRCLRCPMSTRPLDLWPAPSLLL
eukprot:9716129-Alexandrium_andersonii.AAC.1